MFKRLVLLAAAPILATSMQANATLVSSVVQLSGFDISTTDTATFDFIDDDLHIADILSNVGTLLEANDFNTDLFPVSSSVANTYGNGSVQGDADASGGDSFNAVSVIDAGIIEGLTVSDLGFEVSGAGEIFIDIFYTILIDIIDPMGSEFAFGGVSAVSNFADDAFEFGFDGSSGDVFEEAVGVLSLNFQVDGDDSGFLVIETLTIADSDKVAVVSVPGTLALFALGLMGMNISRRRNKYGVDNLTV